MTFPNAWAAVNQWGWPVTVILVITAAVAAFSYFRTRGSIPLRFTLAGLKFAAVALLAICLLEPVHQFTRPEPGANLLMVMVDDSQSLQVKDRGQTESRADQIQQRLNADSNWLNRLTEIFDVRRYQFDQRLRPVANFTQFAADQRGTDLLGNVNRVARRFDGRPAAGVVMISDGNDSLRQSGLLDADSIERDLESIDWERVPPVYPVVVGTSQPAADIGITRVVTSNSNFETAPITINVSMVTHGFANQKLAVEMLDETGELLERKEIEGVEDGKEFVVRFQTRPQKPGINVFQVQVFPASIDAEQLTNESSTEATLVNNRQLVVVNRGRGPYRVLYLCGRPNWELKFLQRSMQDDPEVNLVSLIRIAKREAKFTFRGREGQQSNSLFRGYETQDDDTTEQHDEPVFIRIGTRDGDELRGGFPKDPETLYQYDAIILDDVEVGFFDADQKALLQKFVSLRGGGLLMMGGQESFAGGDYDRTPIGEMLPVYLDRVSPSSRNAEYRLDLTREGWLQPWVRIRRTEPEEQQRLREMPGFRTINRTDSIKPGATVLATVSSDERKTVPALVTQPFGKGRVAAMLIGDLWRWHMRTEVENQDLFSAWRQTCRWLVADVPRRVEMEVERQPGAATSRRIEIRVRDELFLPYDNADIRLTVETPSGDEILLSTTADGERAGVYDATFTATTPGVYKARAVVSADDGSLIETRELGWVCDPDRDEFLYLTPNRSLLEQIASRSGGEVIDLDDVDRLPDMLETRPVPISQQRSLPWWHRWSVLAVALGLLVTEWGVRRWKGMP